MAGDKDWAHSYLIDPLTAPEPSDETGPGTHFRSTYAPASPAPPPAQSTIPTGSSSTTNPYRRSLDGKEGTTAQIRETSIGTSPQYPSPPTSTSPRHVKFSASPPREALSSYTTTTSPRERRSSEQPRSPTTAPTSRPRGNSLQERYPGDTSHRPLEMLKKDAKLAQRSPHLKKQHLPGADTIDKLDVTRYHHEGPYDAASLARNAGPAALSPVAALSSTNEEALRATPRENVRDAVRGHRPLEGVAAVPPGEPDRFGRRLEYVEGENMMVAQGGNYKRWPGVNYAPDDVEGKGEPAYSLERAFKEHRISGDPNGGAEGIELTERPRRKSLGQRDPVEIAGGQQKYSEWEQGVARSNSTSKKVTEGLKKRIGSLRGKKE